MSEGILNISERIHQQSRFSEVNILTPRNFISISGRRYISFTYTGTEQDQLSYLPKQEHRKENHLKIPFAEEGFDIFGNGGLPRMLPGMLQRNSFVFRR
jgi:hypothetical protein